MISYRSFIDDENTSLAKIRMIYHIDNIWTGRSEFSNINIQINHVVETACFKYSVWGFQTRPAIVMQPDRLDYWIWRSINKSIENWTDFKPSKKIPELIKQCLTHAVWLIWFSWKGISFIQFFKCFILNKLSAVKRVYGWVLHPFLHWW